MRALGMMVIHRVATAGVITLASTIFARYARAHLIHLCWENMLVMRACAENQIYVHQISTRFMVKVCPERMRAHG